MTQSTKLECVECHASASLERLGAWGLKICIAGCPPHLHGWGHYEDEHESVDFGALNGTLLQAFQEGGTAKVLTTPLGTLLDIPKGESK